MPVRCYGIKDLNTMIYRHRIKKYYDYEEFRILSDVKVFPIVRMLNYAGSNYE
jgi:hypothetical protein